MSEYDVIIAGAGPGGSTAATFLAEDGYRVLVLEKAQFPRHHIGESLLPPCLPILDQLKLPLPKSISRFKQGAQFICEETARSLTISFAEALPGPPRHAWQVDRPQFDVLLRDRARSAGATVHHDRHVRSVNISPQQVTVTSSHKTYTARYFLDATGQGRLMARLHGSIQPLKDFGRAAVYQHFDNVPAERLGSDGDIRIMMRPCGGWAWGIPMPGDRLSLGLVSRDRGLNTQSLSSMIAGSPLLRDWTRGSAPSTPRLVGNYSYINTSASGLRYTCIGDAAYFLDPVFSSGVSLALVSAAKTARKLSTALRYQDESDPRLMDGVQADMKVAFATFSALIRRFYHTKMVDNLFFNAAKEEAYRPGIVSVLAGDVWRQDNPFQAMLLRSRRFNPRPTMATASV